MILSILLTCLQDNVWKLQGELSCESLLMVEGSLKQLMLDERKKKAEGKKNESQKEREIERKEKNRKEEKINKEKNKEIQIKQRKKERKRR